MRHTPTILGPILLLSLLGCQITAHPAVEPAPRNVIAPDGTILLNSASMATLRGDVDRLEDDIFRSFRDLAWGSMGITARDNAWEDGASAGEPAMVVSGPHVVGRALTPDGRHVEALAWRDPEKADHVRVAIQIGHFGDPVQERQFLAMLQTHLQAPPRPQRDRSFTLP